MVVVVVAAVAMTVSDRDVPITAGSRAGRIEVLTVDLHGRLRGKWLRATDRDKLIEGAVRFPLSTQTQNLDTDDYDALRGRPIDDGDPDGYCRVSPDELRPAAGETDVEEALCTLCDASGEPHFADPRGQLRRAIAGLQSLGYEPVVAFELEFHVIDGRSRRRGRPAPPVALAEPAMPGGGQLYDYRALDAMAPLLERIHRYADRQRVPTETTLAEGGSGQFEINLTHRRNALEAADDAVRLKRIVERATADEGHDVTFMAKPYTDAPGSGMHVHMSLLDRAGRNRFDARENGGDERLRHVVAGLLTTLPDLQPVFAPFANSYRRLVPDGFAPARLDWGYEHRGTAIRVPAASGDAARFEHRVAGADASPYLVLAAILAGVRHGLETGIPPASPPRQPGESPSAPVLSHDWRGAVERMAKADTARRAFGERYRRVFTDVKRFEAEAFHRRVTDADYACYLSRL